MLKRMVESCYNLCCFMIKRPVGEAMFNIIKLTKVHILLNRIYHNENYKNPTEDMLEARVFFEENKERVDRVSNMLADRESKDVYRKMVRFRQYSNPKELPTFSEKDQYFVKGIIKIKQDEKFVDCGAFTGDSVKSFLKHGNSAYDKIVCFEPDLSNVKQLDNFVEKKKLKNVKIIKAGVWNKKDVLKFSNGNSAGSSIGEDDVNTTQIDVIDIDSVAECADATFIKMDIEGAEFAALEGAKNIIKRNRPTLTICIYHSHEDMIRIPEYIKSLVPEYKFYIRQHVFQKDETVLYAVIEE